MCLDTKLFSVSYRLTRATIIQIKTDATTIRTVMPNNVSIEHYMAMTK